MRIHAMKMCMVPEVKKHLYTKKQVSDIYLMTTVLEILDIVD
jgi:hypothetical protein